MRDAGGPGGKSLDLTCKGRVYSIAMKVTGLTGDGYIYQGHLRKL